MNNKCGCDTSCQAGAAFVPVNGNWDFNMDGGCQRQNRGNGRSDCTCETCTRSRNAERSTCGQTCTASENNNGTRQADCACETCTRSRNAERSTCGQTCTANENNNGTRQADCTCESCTRSRNAERSTCDKQKNKADNRGVGIMWAKMQELGEVYDCGYALTAGTLYPELHKPMNGYCPCDEDCGDKCQQTAFAMWELRLYLNTHPCDQEALAMLHRLQTECCEPNYATTFLEDVCCTDGTRNPVWRWTRDPWPWEYEANCDC